MRRPGSGTPPYAGLAIPDPPAEGTANYQKGSRRVELTEPYWTDGQVTLYLGDCREVTEWRAADVLVTDPPYGRGSVRGTRGDRGSYNANRSVGRTYAGAAHMNDPDPIAGDEDTATRDAALTAWGPKTAIVFGDLRIPAPAGTAQVLIYQKPPDAGFRSVAGFRRDVEAIYLLHLPATYGGRSSVIATSARLIGCGGPSTRYGHPHAKPTDVMETLISACPAGVIADPFAGSGSTLVAARNLGRHAIGVEIEERYCEAAARRLAQGVLPAA